ncbi:TPA: hypothetical protein RPD71_004717 [Escherichia coli]|nr:hypothetical protein [Escherichia coli]
MNTNNGDRTRGGQYRYIGDATDRVNKQLHGGSVPLVGHDFDAVVGTMHMEMRVSDKRAIVVVRLVYHNANPRVLGVTCYEHRNVQYGTAVMTPNLRTHDGDTANTLTR